MTPDRLEAALAAAGPMVADGRVLAILRGGPSGGSWAWLASDRLGAHAVPGVYVRGERGPVPASHYYDWSPDG